MEPIIGISSLHYNWTSLKEAFERCVIEFGFDVIEFSYTSLFQEKEFSQIKKFKDKYNVKVGLHIWDNLPEIGKERAILNMTDYLNISSISGFNFITCHLGKYSERQVGLDIVFEVLEKIMPIHEKKNIILCIENHYIDELGNCPEEFLYLFERISSPFLKFCFDYGHANLTGNIFEFIEKLHKYFGIVHISDNNGDKDEHLHYGDGNINWKDVLTYTLKKGFFGPYIIEFGGKNEKIEKFKKFESDLNYILNNL